MNACRVPQLEMNPEHFTNGSYHSIREQTMIITRYSNNLHNLWTVDGSSRLEVGNNKWATARYIPVFISFHFFSWWLMVSARGRWYLREVTLTLSCTLFMTSKIMTHKTSIKDWVTSTYERTLTEWHTEYNTTNTMCRCTQLHFYIIIR